MYHRIAITDEAAEMLRKIGKRFGKKTYEQLRDLIRELESEPEKRGEALRRPLTGLYSLHYSRFRVVYEIRSDEALVLVVAAGHRESGSRHDIYRVIRRLVETGAIIMQEDATPGEQAE